MPGSAWRCITTSQTGQEDKSVACQAAVASTDGSRYNQRLKFTQIKTAANGTAVPATGNTWDTAYAYNNEGYQTLVTYPMGQNYVTGLDFMKRPATLTYQRPGVSIAGPLIQSVQCVACVERPACTWLFSSTHRTIASARERLRAQFRTMPARDHLTVSTGFLGVS